MARSATGPEPERELGGERGVRRGGWCRWWRVRRRRVRRPVRLARQPPRQPDRWTGHQPARRRRPPLPARPPARARPAGSRRPEQARPAQARAARPSSSSTTCSHHETPRNPIRVLQSGAGRRHHAARGARRAVPLLRRQPGVAVRADAGAEGRDRRWVGSGGGQRCAGGWVPGGVGVGPASGAAGVRCGGGAVDVEAGSGAWAGAGGFVGVDRAAEPVGVEVGAVERRTFTAGVLRWGDGAARADVGAGAVR